MTNAKPLFLSALLSLAACGDPAADFVGTWSESGTVTLTVNGSSQTNAISQTVRISQGVKAGEILLDGDCMLTASVEGDVATISPGMSCTQQGSWGSGTMTFRTGSFSRGEKTMVFTGSGDILYTRGGQAVTIGFTETTTLMRIGD